MLAKLIINAKLAKSDGWKDPIIGIEIQRDASLIETPFVNV